MQRTHRSVLLLLSTKFELSPRTRSLVPCGTFQQGSRPSLLTCSIAFARRFRRPDTRSGNFRRSMPGVTDPFPGQRGGFGALVGSWRWREQWNGGYRHVRDERSLRAADAKGRLCGQPRGAGWVSALRTHHVEVLLRGSNAPSDPIAPSGPIAPGGCYAVGPGTCGA